MNIDVDLMLTITAGIILAQIISYGFSFFFSSGARSGSVAKGGGNSLKKDVFERPKKSSLDLETIKKNFDAINNNET